VTARASDDDAPVLLVGFTLILSAALEAVLPAGSVIVLEEPDVLRKRDVATKAAAFGCIREVIPVEYQLPAAADRFAAAHPDLSASAVLPGLEYAVPFAARLAERFALPGAGFGAARLLRDKHLLRQVSAAAGIANPVSRPVADLAELAAFAAEHGFPVVLKPANRQGSLGVEVIRTVEQLPGAWRRAQDQDEGVMVPDRGFPVRMLAETFLDGPELSVEMFVRAGRPLFGNVTGKLVHPGTHPVELGHQVPAACGERDAYALVGATEALIRAIGFGTGIVHCEWILVDGRPHLVECAGRLPGDGIMDLIAAAYGFSPYRTLVRLLRGARVRFPAGPRRGAAVWFLTAEPGCVARIDGVERAGALPGVFEVDMDVDVGATVSPVRSSGDRVGCVSAVGSDAVAALEAARFAATTIQVVTEPGRDPVHVDASSDVAFPAA
jgi:biotin carboxylase